MLTSIVKGFGFALYALGRKAHPVGAWWLVVEQSITQSMGFTVQSAVTDWTILRVLAEKRPTQNLASSLLYRDQRLKVSSPRSESGGDNLPITLPMHPGEALASLAPCTEGLNRAQDSGPRNQGWARL